jgi:chromosomal replication initiation ATPase DnaA
MGEGHRKEFHCGTSEGSILGDDTFVEEELEKAKQEKKKPVTVGNVIEQVFELYGLTEEEIVSGGKRRYPSEARGMVACLVREINGLPLTELSRRMKRDITSLSHATDRIIRSSKDDDSLGRKRKMLEEALL